MCLPRSTSRSTGIPGVLPALCLVYMLFKCSRRQESLYQLNETPSMASVTLIGNLHAGMYARVYLPLTCNTTRESSLHLQCSHIMRSPAMAPSSLSKSTTCHNHAGGIWQAAGRELSQRGKHPIWIKGCAPRECRPRFL